MTVTNSANNTAEKFAATAPIPMWLLAELTYACPLQCPYCSNPLKLPSSRTRELMTAEWLSVMRQARKLGAVQLPDHRHGRKGPQRGLVRRCQVVEVKDVRARRSRPGECLAPGGDEPLVGLVVDGREDAIRSARPVLVRRLEGNDRRSRVGRPPGR